MKYLSSRGKYWCEASAQAIKMGLSPDGGLFVPENIPVLDSQQLQTMGKMTYQERAQQVLALYLDDFSALELEKCVKSAYGSDRFDDPAIAPLHHLSEQVYIQELWHGPTCAFKDMALQMLPHLLTFSMIKCGDKNQVLILVATSGDTGKAALEGFADVPGTRIVVFFPEEGVSEVQKLQMVTQEGNNVLVSAVKGNFDDAQNGVKEIFADQTMAALLKARGFDLSSANSINWGRLVPQIVYYVSAYLDLVEQQAVSAGDAINVVVPTGNFGNILAAYYAKRMGLPINRLICASNSNNVLTDFIKSGVYDRSRHFHKTLSPSMDILISSNLERLLFEMTGRNSRKVAGWMEELKDKGIYTVDEDLLSKIQQCFWADYTSDQETMATIAEVWMNHGYLVDTHTAVAINVYNKFRAASGDTTPAVIASTASPYKFGGSVARALLGEEAAGLNEFDALELLEKYTGVPVPGAIRGLESRPIRFDISVERSEMGDLLARMP